MSYIAVDQDGTLATYNKGDYHKKGPTFIGAPIPSMVEISKGVLNDLKMANETRSEFDQQRFMAACSMRRSM